LREALDYLDKEGIINFKDFDADGDGSIDAITFLYVFILQVYENSIFCTCLKADTTLFCNNRHSGFAAEVREISSFPMIF
jgi:hypothetical protein